MPGFRGSRGGKSKQRLRGFFWGGDSEHESNLANIANESFANIDAFVKRATKIHFHIAHKNRLQGTSELLGTLDIEQNIFIGNWNLNIALAHTSFWTSFNAYFKIFGCDKVVHVIKIDYLKIYTAFLSWKSMEIVNKLD